MIHGPPILTLFVMLAFTLSLFLESLDPLIKIHYNCDNIYLY